MVALLNEGEIQSRLTKLNDWSLEGKTLKTTKVFEGFPDAIAFVNKLVDPAEAAGHHPDLVISYNKVTIRLTTHDAGGLTQKDFGLATQIDGMS